MKVKNIMFSGFAAAILMGVVAEANAAPKVVASKGYVDTITGKLDGLNGSAQGKANLVEAINTKLGRVAATGEALEDGEYYSSVTQAQNGQVAIQKANLATTIEDGVMKAPTTDAVHAAIQEVSGDIQTYTSGTDINVADDNTVNATYASLDYESANDTVDSADKLARGYAVSYVRQVDGKVKIGAKAYNDTVNAEVAVSAAGAHAPSTKAVWNAIEGLDGQTVDLDLDAVGGDGKYVKLVSQSDGQLAATEGTIDTAMDRTSNNPVTNAAITTALAGKQDTLQLGDNLEFDADGRLNATVTTYEAGTNVTIEDGKISTTFPEMPAACQADGVTCVLTSEGGEFVWAILAKPYTYGSGTETDAERISDLGYAAQQQKIPEAQ